MVDDVFAIFAVHGAAKCFLFLKYLNSASKDSSFRCLHLPRSYPSENIRASDFLWFGSGGCTCSSRRILVAPLKNKLLEDAFRTKQGVAHRGTVGVPSFAIDIDDALVSVCSSSTVFFFSECMKEHVSPSLHRPLLWQIHSEKCQQSQVFSLSHFPFLKLNQGGMSGCPDGPVPPSSTTSCCINRCSAR